MAFGANPLMELKTVIFQSRIRPSQVEPLLLFDPFGGRQYLRRDEKAACFRSRCEPILEFIKPSRRTEVPRGSFRADDMKQQFGQGWLRERQFFKPL